MARGTDDVTDCYVLRREKATITTIPGATRATRATRAPAATTTTPTTPTTTTPTTPGIVSGNQWQVIPQVDCVSTLGSELRIGKYFNYDTRNMLIAQ